MSQRSILISQKETQHSKFKGSRRKQQDEEQKLKEQKTNKQQRGSAKPKANSVKTDKSLMILIKKKLKQDKNKQCQE